jgi:hypothetical protein
MTTPFYMGPGLCREPTAADVLECLALDASSVECSDGFGDWARDLGYDEDSRRASAIYDACEKVARRLRRFLGADYDAYLYDTE